MKKVSIYGAVLLSDRYIYIYVLPLLMKFIRYKYISISILYIGKAVTFGKMSSF